LAAAQPANTEQPTVQSATPSAEPQVSAVNAPNNQSANSAVTAANTQSANSAVTAANTQSTNSAVTAANTQSANDAESVKADSNSGAEQALESAENESADVDAQKNPVKRVVDEMVVLMGDIHEHKQELIARGIPFHTVNMLVEMGVHEKQEELANLRKTSLDLSEKQYGPAGISEEKFDEHLETLIALEKDLGHVKRLGNQQGLDMMSINSLTLIIRQNPGDGGEKMLNTFLAYVMACDIPLTQIESILAEQTAGPKSVLPDIPREQSASLAKAAKKKLITDICVGCALALLALSLLT